jgi:hypothetical protein
MAYYPIKCPYCLQELSNKDVLFNLRTGIAERQREIWQGDIPKAQVAAGPSPSGPPGGEYEGGGNWLEDNTQPATDIGDTAFSSGGEWLLQKMNGGGEWMPNEPSGPVDSEIRAAAANAPSVGYYTYADLQKHFGADNVKPIFIGGIKAPLAMTNNECKDDLLIGVEIKKLEENRETTTAYMRRYCDCGKELMNASGMKPSYVLLMLGSSNSGKTMFLIALHRALSIEGGYILPPQATGSRGIAKQLVSVLSGSDGREDTSLEKMSDKLFDRGALPDTTFSLENEPLVLDVSVDFKKSKSTNALLFMRDMPGEFLINPEKTEQLDKLARQFPKFDGFIFMLDPFTFTEKNVFAANKDSELSDTKYIYRLNQVLTGKITPLMGDHKINKPTAVIITKGDHFFDKQNVQRLNQKGVERSFPTFSPYQRESYDKDYFKEIDKDNQRILSSLSKNIIDMLDKNFSKVFYALVSSLSKEPIGIEFRMVKEIDKAGIEAEVRRKFVISKNAIKPWRVTDPFIRMLMRLHIVPPFDEVEARQPDMDTRENALARNAKYLDEINAWGRKYCSAWEELSGEAIPIPDKRTGKGGLFGRRRN